MVLSVEEALRARVHELEQQVKELIKMAEDLCDKLDRDLDFDRPVDEKPAP